MNYMVYVLCNPARTIFFVGLTGGFTDGIFEAEMLNSPKVSCWKNCTLLVFHRQFRDFEKAVSFLDTLQKNIEAWDFETIERKNRDWNDLSTEWLSPVKLLSFQVFRNSFQCFEN